MRLKALAQIAVVVLGVFGAVAALDRAGIGAGGPRLGGAAGLVAHVLIIAGISVTLALVVLRRDQVRALGLERVGFLRLAFFTLIGAMVTFVVNAIVVLAWVSTHGGVAHEADVAREKAAALSTLAAIPLSVMVPVAVLAGLYEEIVFRGFLLGRLRIVFSTARPIYGDVAAVVVSSVIFGLGHLYQGALGVAQTTFAGLCLGALMVVSRSLWPSVVTHAGIDATSLVVLHLISPMVDKVLRELPR